MFHNKEAIIGIYSQAGCDDPNGATLFSFTVNTSDKPIYVSWGDGNTETINSGTPTNHTFCCPDAPAAKDFWDNINVCITPVTTTTTTTTTLPPGTTTTPPPGTTTTTTTTTPMPTGQIIHTKNNWVQRGTNLALNSTGDHISTNYDGTVVVSCGTDIINVSKWNPTTSTWDNTVINNPNGNTIVDISSDGNAIVYGRIQADIFPTDSGYVGVYQWTGSSWVEKGSEIFVEYIWSNQSWDKTVVISGDGNVIAIGEPAWNFDETENRASPTVKVYEWSGVTWLPRGNTITPVEFNPTGSNYFGTYLALDYDGDTIAVVTKSVNAGVDMFKLVSNTWESLDIKGYVLNADNVVDAVALNASGNIITFVMYSESSYTVTPEILVYAYNGPNNWRKLGGNINAPGGEYVIYPPDILLSVDDTASRITWSVISGGSMQNSTIRVVNWTGSGWSTTGQITASNRMRGFVVSGDGETIAAISPDYNQIKVYKAQS